MLPHCDYAMSPTENLSDMTNSLWRNKEVSGLLFSYDIVLQYQIKREK